MSEFHLWNKKKKKNLADEKESGEKNESLQVDLTEI